MKFLYSLYIASISNACNLAWVDNLPKYIMAILCCSYDPHWQVSKTTSTASTIDIDVYHGRVQGHNLPWTWPSSSCPPPPCSGAYKNTYLFILNKYLS